MTVDEAVRWLAEHKPGYSWEVANVSGATYIGLPCPDGIMLYHNLAALPIDRAAQRTLEMTGAKRVEPNPADPAVDKRDPQGDQGEKHII